VVADKFKIYAMRARQGVDGELYLKQHFYELNGRVFQPYGEERKVYFAYAIPTNLDGSDEIYNELEKYFVINECKMGEDPEVVLEEKIRVEIEKPIATPQWLTMHYLEREPDRGVLLGYYKNEAHLKWILGNNDRGSLIYNVRLKTKGEEVRDGAHSASFYDKQNIKFVVLYTDGVETTGEYRVFHVKDTAKKVTEERMKGTWYPSDVKGDYYFFRFDEEVNIGRLNIVDLIRDVRVKHREDFGSHVKYEPMFTTAGEVKKYRDGF
jgi:hypothetical protein